ncbi:hypothetical protein ACLB2K_068573 [Fragaria x ananassa]
MLEKKLLTTEPSYRDYVEKYGVWDFHEYKGQAFRRLKPLHQKLFRDIMEAALSRYTRREAIGKWDLDSIKIWDNNAVLPPTSAASSYVNPARMVLNLAYALFGTDGDVPDRESFYLLLKMLTGMKEFESVRVCFESLIFHRLIRSAKENIDFVGNALDYLKVNRVRFENASWDQKYKTWTSSEKYDIRVVCKNNKYFRQVFEYRYYPDSCISLLQFLKNLFKHVNEYREADGEAEWSHEELDMIADFYFPKVMGGFYEFLWAHELPMDFRKSRLSVPPIIKDNESLMSIEAFSETPSELATGNIQVIKNSEIQLIYKVRPNVYYGKWKACMVSIKIEQGTSDELRADFQKKVEILNQLKHPNIVAFYGVVRDGPRSTLATVTEYMINGSLKEVLQINGTIDHWKKLTIAKNAALALQYIHEKSSDHFNLNSGNFLLDMRDPKLPLCKIGDMELASVGAQGNEPWMAPELLNGTTKNFLELEKEPYANLSSEEIKDRTINDRRPEIPTSCDPKWRSLMERCWSANPDCRPPFSDIAKALVEMSAVKNFKRLKKIVNGEIPVSLS